MINWMAPKDRNMEPSHLDQAQIERCLKNQLLPDEIMTVYRHIGDCEQCRIQVASPGNLPFSELRAGIFVAENDLDEHLTEAELIGFADNTLGRIDRQIVESHLAICSQCGEAIQRLHDFQALVEKYPQPVLEPLSSLTLWERLKALSHIPALHFTLPSLVTAESYKRAFIPAFAVALIVLVLCQQWYVARQFGNDRAKQLASAQNALKTESIKRQAAEARERELLSQQQQLSLLAQSEKQKQSEESHLITQLRQQLSNRTADQLAPLGQRLYRDRKGALVFTQPVPIEDQKWVAALAKGTVDIPPQIKEWSQAPLLLGGNVSKPNSISLLSPVNTLILSRRPLFRWNSRHPGRFYRLTLQTEAREPVATIVITNLQNGQGEAEVYGKETSQIVEHSRMTSAMVWNMEISNKLPPLLPGLGYRWWIEELARPDKDAAPQTGAATSIAQFKIADTTTETQVKRAQSRYAGSPLLLGGYYAKMGFIEAAREEFRLVTDKTAVAHLLKTLPPAP